jgi:hypothetical protein
MKRLHTAVILALLGLPVTSLAESWSKVPLIDHMCMEKKKADPDTHTTECLLKCANSGYGIMSEGKWMALDESGNKKAMAALKATTKKDHIRVDVTGAMKDGKVAVETIKLAD